MYVWAQGVLFLMLAVLTLPALGAMVRWPGLHTGAIDKELAYGMLLAHYLPAGVLGLALVAMFASIMSTVDSNMNFGAQVFINDVYRRLISRDAGLEQSMAVGRAVMLGILGLALVVATQARNVIDIAVFMLGLSSAELTANWGQWWWWRFNGPARLAASLGGPVIFLLNDLVVFEYLVDGGEGTPYLVVLASIALTGVLWVSVALLTHPEPEARLVDFYRRARPLGWWGPIARKAGVEAGGPGIILRGLGLALLGAATMGAAVIALSTAYVGTWRVAGLCGTFALVAGLGFRVGYRRFLVELGAPPAGGATSPT
jgi:Na+/proline symporter